VEKYRDRVRLQIAGREHEWPCDFVTSPPPLPGAGPDARAGTCRFPRRLRADARQRLLHPDAARAGAAPLAVVPARRVAESRPDSPAGPAALTRSPGVEAGSHPPGGRRCDRPTTPDLARRGGAAASRWPDPTRARLAGRLNAAFGHHLRRPVS
jgi:hypothetical protein